MAGLAARVDVGEVAGEVLAAVLGLGDHRLEALDLAPQGRDLAVDPVEVVEDDRAALGGSAVDRKCWRLRVAGLLVLEQLPDLREREPGVVAQPADEPQALEVLGVVQAVGAVGAGGGGEQPQLLVVADRARREPGVGGDLLDAEEALGGGAGSGRRCRSRRQFYRTLPFT